MTQARPPSIRRDPSAPYFLIFANSSHSRALALMARWKSARRELLVGTVRVVVVLPPAQQERVRPQRVMEGAHDGNRAALAGIDGRPAEGVLDRAGRRRHVGAVQRNQDARRAVVIVSFPK